MNAVVVGLGLIGGSVALALREADGAAEIVGVDRTPVLGSPAVKRLPLRLLDAAETTLVDAAFASADLVVLAAPVRVIIELVPRALAAAAIVTDCGSTKRSIAAVAGVHPRRGRFVPGHPMAGAPEGGAEFARADLFRDRRWLLCPDGSDADAANAVEALVRKFGAKAERFGVDEHDRAVARTSHLTQLVSSALVVTARKVGAERAAGPAFEGATRSAGGPEAIWSDIFQTNADEVASALADLIGELEATRAALKAEPPELEAARALLRRAKETRRRHQG
jgi:prephenate dehydrogenase